MADKQYDFDSGDLCLDFANTSDWHASERPIEKLSDYDDLVTWGEQAQALSAAQAMQLRQIAVRQPDEANQIYQKALALRETIYGIFSSLYAGRTIPDEDLKLINAELARAMPNLELAAQGDAIAWHWTEDSLHLDRMLWPVVRSAALLLTSDQRNRVRECEDDRGCGYLFIDQSKNHSRRWCSMESCGNRAKARRHYARQH